METFPTPGYLSAMLHSFLFPATVHRHTPTRDMIMMYEFSTSPGLAPLMACWCWLTSLSMPTGSQDVCRVWKSHRHSHARLNRRQRQRISRNGSSEWFDVLSHKRVASRIFVYHVRKRKLAMIAMSFHCEVYDAPDFQLTIWES